MEGRNTLEGCPLRVLTGGCMHSPHLKPSSVQALILQEGTNCVSNYSSKPHTHLFGGQFQKLAICTAFTICCLLDNFMKTQEEKEKCQLKSLLIHCQLTTLVVRAFCLEAQAVLPMPKALALRQAFEPVVFGKQQNSYYFMAPLPGAA